MKILLSACLLALVSVPAFASEVRIVGAAATELYSSLNIAEVTVRDEHGGADQAVAKYGKFIGCIKSLDNGNAECWVIN